MRPVVVLDAPHPLPAWAADCESDVNRCPMNTPSHVTLTEEMAGQMLVIYALAHPTQSGIAGPKTDLDQLTPHGRDLLQFALFL